MSQATRRTDATEQGYVTREIPNDRQPSQVVVETVASVEEVEPIDLSTQLYDSVDPEALNSLSAGANDGNESLRITFNFDGYEVAVVDGNRVVVRGGADDRPR
ncbi:HalOD1 output domain-containing protein [Halosimplex sp. J119]